MRAACRLESEKPRIHNGERPAKQRAFQRADPLRLRRRGRIPCAPTRLSPSVCVATMNAAGPLALLLSLILASFFKKQTPKKAAKFVDSTKLEVCKIKRGFSYKVCKGIAKKSKSTMGWFIGFK